MSSGPFALTSVAQSYLTSGNSLVTGLGGVDGFGEFQMPPDDDDSTGAIDITSVFGPAGLNFFGTNYTSIYINKNGNITFDAPITDYTPEVITAGTDNPIIAAFWADVDTRGGETPVTPGGNSTGANRVSYDLDAANGVLTVTWDDVGYFSSNNDKANAFQIQLINRGNGDFDIIYRYEDINWTTGDSSGGSGGLGGTPARAGYSSGDGKYFELPGSGNQTGMLDLEDNPGNRGQDGVWIFEVRNGSVEPVNIAPIATADVKEVSEDPFSLAARATTGNVLANDSDPDEGDVIKVTAVNGSAEALGQVITGEYGTLVLKANGSYTYRLANTDALIAGEQDVEHFTYTIVDRQGATATATLTINITGADLVLSRTGSFKAHRGDDQITGSDGADQFAGRGGNDKLRGEGGADTLWGEAGNDQLLAGDGDDKAVGGTGDDVIRLGTGNDTGWGEDGRDVIWGEAGNDTVDGGAGDDRLVLGDGADEGWGGAGNDRIEGGIGDDRLTGGLGNDRLTGGDGGDHLWGGAGADVLDGGAGADVFSGDTGKDRIILGAGDDTAWGGADSDVFVFAPGTGLDRIKDFQDGDRIELKGLYSSFAQVQQHMKVVGDDVVIDLPGAGNSITIERTGLLDKFDFVF